MKISNKPFIIVLFGPAGAGKTTLAEALKSELKNTAHIGVDHIKRFISEFRETPSHQLVSKKVINRMVDEYLNNGINVIIDQGMSGEEIRNLETIAQRHEANFFVYGLSAKDEVMQSRIEERSIKTNKPLVPEHEVIQHKKIYQENDYSPVKFIDSGELEVKEKVDLILKDLGL